MITKYSRWAMNRSLGLLFIRLAVGMVFFAHGWMKVNNMDIVEGMFVGLGFPVFAATFVAWLEVIGGAALILGVCTRVFAKLFAITMFVAFFATGGFATGYAPHELELALLFASLGLMFTGGGRYSLWPMECHRCGAMFCKGNCAEHK